MSQRRSKRPQCSHDNCGSRRFHVGDDGFTYCDQGHQQLEAGLVVAEDTGELVTAGRTSRRKADSDAESGTTRVSGFTGPKAYEHYLLCVQLVLRKQLRWLIDVQKLPEELETLVRDLWALRLQKLHHKVSYDSDAETDAQSSRMFSSQSEGESGTDVGAAASRRSQALREQARGPNLTELVSLVHVGIMMLKIPITVADMHNWIQDGQLLFYRAAKEIPLSMRDRLPGQYQDLLEQQDLIKPEALHRKNLDLLMNFNAEFGMGAPNLNHPLLLYRWVKALSLPLEIYVATQRLGRLFELDFGHSLDAKAWSNLSLRYPEIRLMSLIVITTKLLFPFNSERRYPTTASDLAALNMDWQLWEIVQTRGNDVGEDHGELPRLSYHDAFNMTESQSLGLADDRLDQYLDWYESNIASEEVRERGRAGREAEFRRTLFKMFPADDRHSATAHTQTEIIDEGSSSAPKLVEVQAALNPKRIVAAGNSDDIPRAGSMHTQFRAADQLSGATKLFHEKAAQLAGSSLQGMVRAVFVMERELMKLEKDWKQRNREEMSPSMV